MTGTDPAVDAAQRAWDDANIDGQMAPFEHLPRRNPFVKIQVSAAREALAPIRELHKPEPGDWPCPTARLIYSETELTGRA